MKKYFFLLIFLLSFNSHAQKLTLTDSLTQVFNKLWDTDDVEGMYNMLRPDAFFKSPFQLMYGMDTMKETVLKWNPLKFKNTRSTETYSHVEKDLCYSLGTMIFSVFDVNGI